MALPSGPIENKPDTRAEMRNINDLDELMEVWLETDENATYKGFLFIKFEDQGDSRFLPIGDFPAGGVYPTVLDAGVLVGSRTIKEMLGENINDPEANIIKTYLDNAGIAEPPAPLEVWIETGTPRDDRHLLGQMFVKYSNTVYRKLNDYNFTIASIEKPSLYNGDLNLLFDSNEVDTRFVIDFQDRNS